MPSLASNRHFAVSPAWLNGTLASSTDRAQPELAPVQDFRPALAAHRAVEAVVELAAVQLDSRLQSAPSVNLRLKLGGEDLSIKVAVREGVVQTQFQTDSADLRAALSREWTAVRTEAPERVVRFLDPEFSSTGGGTSGSSGGQQQQQQSAQGQAFQQFARQGQQAEVFGAVGRSYHYGPADEAAALPAITPLIPPTSLHLSTVA